MIRRIRNLGASGVLVALTQVFLIVVIAQFRGLKEIGEYSYILALCVPLNVLGLFGFKQVLASQQDSAMALAKALKIRFAFHSVIYFIFILLVALISLEVSLSFVIALSLFKFIESHHELHIGAYQNNNLTSAIDKLNVFKCLVYILIALLVVLSNLDLAWVFTIGSGALLVHYYWVLRPQSNLSSNTNTNLEGVQSSSILRIASRLVFIALFTALLANLPKYYLMAYSNIEQLAIFTLFFQALSFVNMLVINLINYQWGKIKQSVEAQAHQASAIIRHTHVKKLLLLTSIVSVAVVGFSFISMHLVSFVFNVDTQPYFIEWLLVNVAFAFNFYSHLLNALNILLKKEQALAQATLLNFVVALLFGYFLPLNQGVLGASVLLLVIFGLKGAFGTTILLKGASREQ
ncbi:hypothetical protein N9L48_06540 [Psychrosphaera sp.]|nr:hypothetical protein [Psychrosphaera sp.]